MNKPTFIEVTADDVESAIEQGIDQLGVARSQVMVEVLQEPVRRMLGLGSTPAQVRLTVIGTPAQPKSETKADSSSTSSVRTPRPQRAKPTRPYADLDEDYTEPAEEPFEEDAPANTPLSEEDLAEDAKVGAAILQQLLDKMNIEATVTPTAAQLQEEEAQHWTLEVQGRNLAGLIGRHGDTLAALQYLTRLIASKELGRRANIVIDVEGYKARRESMLYRLAKRMADQAIQRGRTVALEPMPPHERRIIHIALRNNPDVTTESVGEGERRKVTIVPKKAR